jgi:hypothetical protein
MMIFEERKKNIKIKKNICTYKFIDSKTYLQWKG